MSPNTIRQAAAEYIVVGSGAGGGTVAARLAEAGRTVLLLEAGGDPRKLSGSDVVEPGVNRLPDDYDVPCFHPFATENDAIKWDVFVRHYASDALQRRDDKYRENWNGKRVDGVLYPRAGTLGGCTAHNAMILVYPHNDDWDHIAQLTGDPSWCADKMRAYFERLEDCRHRLLYRLLAKLGINPTRHGWKGWLRSEKAIPRSVLCDNRLLDMMVECAHDAFEEIGHPLARIASLLKSQMDPNDWRMVKRNAEGAWYTPLATSNHARVGTRERLLDVQHRFPNQLKIELDALATKVLFDDAHRAIGVEYLRGKRLYRAHDKPLNHALRCTVCASREVILAGGAFNSPQLLMLSGIGPQETLRRYDIPVRVALPGVGANLQDRYEIGVVNRMAFDEWSVLRGAKFSLDDRLFLKWKRNRKGVYGTNGAALALLKRSTADRPRPDQLFLGLLGRFEGCFPG